MRDGIQKRFQIVFLRHSRSVANQLGKYSNSIGDPLTKAGQQEASKLGCIIQKVRYDRVLTSPYVRCIQTAKALTSADVPSIEVVEDLREIALGHWHDKTENEVESEYPKEWVLWNSQPDLLDICGRETLNDVSTRVISWFNRFVNTNLKQRVLVVTHVVIIRVLLSHFYSFPLSNIRCVKVPNLKMFKFEFMNHDSPNIYESHMPDARTSTNIVWKKWRGLT